MHGLMTRGQRPLSYPTLFLALAVIAAAPSAAMADGSAGPLADGHAPAGVMLDHMHKAGEFMIGYRYMDMRNDGDMLHGTGAASDLEVVQNGCPTDHGAGCTMKPIEMTMRMHMLDIMYAPTDWVTLMVMPQWMTMEMTMAPLEGAPAAGGHGGHMGSHDTDGLGDTILGGLVKLSAGPGHHLHTGLMFSAPTGSVDEKNADGSFTHYHMQLGSGTWDFLPSLTYSGREGPWSWGAQMSGVIRMEDENESGFRFGNLFQATAWGSYRFTSWLSASVRVLHTQQGIIEGHYNGDHQHHSPPDLQGNYGGRFWDVGFGVNTVVPSGPFKGHRLSAEWLEPVSDDPNGYQLERDGTLYVNWSKAF
jgi:hypothetical protein